MYPPKKKDNRGRALSVKRRIAPAGGGLAAKGIVRVRSALAALAVAGLALAPAEAQDVYGVPSDWALKPSGLAAGTQFRLLFVTSTKREANTRDMGIMNAFVQDAAAAGHSAIRPYGSLFRVVACAGSVTAKANTGTDGTGVAIYWLGGPKVADDYADFYDGSWDNRGRTALLNGRGAGLDESGEAVEAGFVWTGCANDGTRARQDEGGTLVSRGLGAALVAFGNLTKHATAPLFDAAGSKSGAYPWYALSPVFEVAASGTVGVGISGPASVTEGSTATFTITATPAPTSDLTVSLNVAASGGDYVASSATGTKSVTVGTSGTATYQVATQGDSVDDGLGELTVTVVKASGYIRRGPAVASVILEDDEATTLALEVTDGTATEGSATADARLSLTLSRQLIAGERLTVPLQFSGGTLGVDFALRPNSGHTVDHGAGAVIFGPGQAAAALVDVYALDDADTSNETVTVSIPSSSMSGSPRLLAAGLGGGVTGSRTGNGQIAITDGGANTPIEMSLTVAASAAEGDSGRTSKTLTFNLSSAATSGVTLGLNIGGTASRGVSSLDDYALRQSGATYEGNTLFFSTGDTSQLFTISVLGDETPEPDETIVVTASHYNSRTPGFAVSQTAGTVTYTIQNDDGSASRTVNLSVSGGGSVTEGGTLTVTASVDLAPSGSSLTIPVQRASSGSTAVAADYTLASSITIADGATSGTATLTAVDDSVDEATETLRLEIGTLPAGLVAGSNNQVDVTIADNDPTTVNLQVGGGGSVTEGGSLTVAVSVSRAPSGSNLSIPVRRASSGSTAVAADYTLPSSITIVAGATSGVASLTAVDDSADEPTETLRLELGTPLPAGHMAGSNNRVDVTIADNDPTTVTLETPDTSATEGSTSATALIRVRLNRGLGSGESLAVPLSFTGGTAGTDFTLTHVATSTGVSFAANTSTVTFTGGNTPSGTSAVLMFRASHDNDGADDTVTVSIPSSSTGNAPRLGATGLGGGATGSRTGNGQIVVSDDDSPGVTLSSGSLSLTEGGATGSYTVRLRTNPGGTATVTPASGDTGAVTVSGALSFNSGNWQTPKTVQVTPVSDGDTNDESVTISHTVSGYGSVTSGPSVTVAVDDDDSPTPSPTPPPTPTPTPTPPSPGGGGGGGGGSPPPPPPGPAPPPPPPPGPAPPPPAPTGPPEASFLLTGADCGEGPDDLCIAFTGSPVEFLDTSSGRVDSVSWEIGGAGVRRRRSFRYAWAAPGYYLVTLRATGAGVTSEASRRVLVRPAAPAGTCEPAADVACFLDERYRATVHWTAADGAEGRASVVREGTNDSGMFWFFDRNNWEVLIKVLDGCELNGHVWVFGASTTDAGYAVTVTDTLGADPPRVYRNRTGEAASAIADTGAFENACKP